jgi:hypothetical protein
MQTIYDAKAKTITIVIPYDDAREYAVNQKTGKTRFVASSGGNVTVPGTKCKVGVNAYQPLQG